MIWLSSLFPGFGLQAPIWLSLGAAWLIVWRLGLRRRSSISATVAVLRALLLTVLGLAIAGPFYESVSEHKATLVVTDLSESMDNGVAEQLITRAQRLIGDNSELRFFSFAGEPAPFADSATGSFSDLKSKWAKLDQGATNIEAGLFGAAALSSNLVLVSDGWETRGDVRSILDLLRTQGVRVTPIFPTDSGSGSAKFGIEFLTAPLTVAAQKSATIRATLVNSTKAPQSGTLEIKHDKKTILKREVSLQPGQEVLVTAQSDPSSEGIKEVTAVLTPSDSTLPSSLERIFISGEQREKILLISGSPQDQRVLAPLLKSNSYQLTELMADGSATPVPNLSDYSVVIYNNVARDQLPASQPERIEEYVKGGGGFIMIGGDRSFGLGKYIDTAIARVLPVELVPPRTEKKRLNVAVQLVIDKSRSMSIEQRMDFSKEAARETIRNLKDDDYVGVIGFDNAPFKVVDIGLVGEIREDALIRVGRLFATGKTNLMPAIDIARRGLMRVDAGRKHMIILTDGELPDGGPHYVELVKQLRTYGITVSTVLLGSDSGDELLQAMAEVGGGGFYMTRNASNLPSIFLKDVRVSTGERTLKEDREYLVRPGPGEISSTTIRSFPPVLGYVQTKQRPGANLELVAMGVESAEPLLASWKYGQGQVVAYTADANGRWSAPWVPWSRFNTFWNELLDSVRPPKDGAERIKFDLTHSIERGSMFIDLSVYNDSVRGLPTATLVAPDGSESKISFDQLSAGRYKTQVSRVIPGKYELRSQIGEHKLTPVAWNVSGELLGEQKGQGFNVPLLEQISSRTGSTLNPATSANFIQSASKSERRSLTWACIAAALLLLLLEIIVRERGLPNFRGLLKRQKAKFF